MLFFRITEGESSEDIRHNVIPVLDNQFKIEFVIPKYHGEEYLIIGIASLGHLEELQHILDDFFKDQNDAYSISSEFFINFKRRIINYRYSIIHKINN